MKKIIVISFAFLISLNVCAQKLDRSAESNGVVGIKTTGFEIQLKDDFIISLLKCYTDTEFQYYIWGKFDNNKPHYFPNDAKLLFKLTSGDNIELTTIFSELIPAGENVWTPTAIYPVTKNQLEQLMKGVSKVRVEMYSLDKEDVVFVDYQDKEYKKDKIGASLVKMNSIIEAEEAKVATQKEKQKQKANISSDF